MRRERSIARRAAVRRALAGDLHQHCVVSDMNETALSNPTQTLRQLETRLLQVLFDSPRPRSVSTHTDAVS
jgi:hypothetical protein